MQGGGYEWRNEHLILKLLVAISKDEENKDNCFQNSESLIKKSL